MRPACDFPIIGHAVLFSNQSSSSGPVIEAEHVVSLVCMLSDLCGLSRLKSSLHGERESVGDVERVGLADAAIAVRISSRADCGRGLRARVAIVSDFAEYLGGKYCVATRYVLYSQTAKGFSCHTYISS